MRLVVRADASLQIGTGHIMRCLALAQAWLEEVGQVTFLMALKAPSLEVRLQTEGIDIIHLSVHPASTLDAEQTVLKARSLGTTWIVVDGYHFDTSYQRTIKSAGFKLLVIDDYGHANHYYADLVLNQNAYAHGGLYTHRESYTQLLLGTRYALLRREFWSWQNWQRYIPAIARKILVTLGGSDPNNVTLKVIKALQKITILDLEVVVVVGGSNPHYLQLVEAVQVSEVSIKIVRNTTNMPELIAWADVAVAAGGSTCWELAFMGLPCILIILAENQRAIVEQLEKLDIAINLGWHAKISSDAIADKVIDLINARAIREIQSERSQQLVDGEGCAKVLLQLSERKLRLRACRQDDCELLWRWANDSEVRLRSFSSEPIPWNTHIEWFQAKLDSPDSHIYIAIDRQDQPVGSIRFACTVDEATVSITIDPQYRGKGYGKSLINLATSRFHKNSHVRVINAYIQPDNHASIKVFMNAGFESQGVVLIDNDTFMQALHLQKQL
jgi:UDP-2,4-diacetamido-2,4,6-trideoxy-beta-L-altropyranose hydrolase